jgi:F-type H+-transporting ATPase subunit delta
LRVHPLARRYAKALFQLADDHNSLEQIAGEVRDWEGVLEQQKELQTVLISPEIGKKEKVAVLHDLLEHRVSTLFYNFILLLVRKGRQSYLPQIAAEFSRLYDQKQSRVRVQLTCAVALSEQQNKEIYDHLRQLFKAELIVEQEVDPAILGGLIVRAEGKIIDASLRHQLEQLRQNLKQVKYV